MIQVSDTDRLSIELMSRDDEELLFELDQDPAVMLHINGGKEVTREHIRDVIVPRMESYRNPEKGWGIWKVMLKPEQKFIGWILVRPMDFFTDNPQWHNLEIGWRFKQETWGKGIAVEAANAVIEAIKAQTDISEICAIAVPENKSSIRVMEKLGMKYIKTYICKDVLGDNEVVYYSKVDWS